MTGWPLRCWEGLCKRLQSNRVEDFYQLDTALGSGAFCDWDGTVYLATCKKTYDKAAATRTQGSWVKLFKRTSASQDVNGCMTYVTLSVGYGAAAGGGSRRYDSLAVADAAIFELRICDPLAFLCLDKLRKIIDFGLACRFEEGQILNDSPGTVMYVAPEILTANYQPPACDLWSYGVVAYLTMSGISPFDADTAKQVARNVKKANYNFDVAWSHGLSVLSSRTVCLTSSMERCTDRFSRHKRLPLPSQPMQPYALPHLSGSLLGPCLRRGQRLPQTAAAAA
ncbi:DAPK2 [Symbiodinium pilosum]|uniref:DAPK2 protein n=1 Tax=Symbiodinium pilosum TaxID=2952 RepID=A0A812W6A8_SYMPI|nr:DAPK2 [Symbiodinium pilosum]